MIEQVPHWHFNVAKDGPKKSGTDGFAGVNWHCSGSSVWMFEKYVTAAGADHCEVDAF